MPTLPARAAAYTRTSILRRFIEQLSDADPGRVDHSYAEHRLGLKGGDVRAFLQTLRVLGLIDPYGETTDRARRMRAGSHRAAAMREALAGAYPELVQRWDMRGGMPRDEVEDFFKMEYGLSTSSTGPAAKLFIDLMREYGRTPPPGPEPATDVSLAQSPAVAVETTRPMASAPMAGAEVRLAALDALKASLKVEINADWDEERIRLVFDRMERLFQRVIEGGE